MPSGGVFDVESERAFEVVVDALDPCRSAQMAFLERRIGLLIDRVLKDGVSGRRDSGFRLIRHLAGGLSQHLVELREVHHESAFVSHYAKSTS